MEKLQIFICENFYPEYQEALELEEFKDVELRVFPLLCIQKYCKAEVTSIFEKSNTNNIALICSKSCDILRFLPERHVIRTVTGEYCFSYIICNEFINYLTSQRSYILSSGWLKKWKENIESLGFDKDTARKFFQETCKQLVLLHTGKDKKNEELIRELSSYVGLPYIIILVELEGIRLMLRSLVYQWRLQTLEHENKLVISQLRNRCAEYSAVFDMLGKISTYLKKREVIDQIKELFITVFGAQNFNFWSNNSPSLPLEVKKFQTSDSKYILFKDSNRFCIKITWGDSFYGIIDVIGFLFPEYIEKYLNLALEISKICGLVFHNNAQYEQFLESEKELKYLSYHDSMTELYNRTYMNQILNNFIYDNKTYVFMFDIDKLKYVNDNFGHAEGDKLIKIFAKILKQSLRENDIIARIGGDEFVALLYDVDNAEVIKQRIVELIEDYNKSIKEKQLELSVSIGYAKSDNLKCVVEDLMKKADQKMYEDKSSKKNRYGRQ